MGRRGENIRKRTDGRWEARYIQSYDVQGKAVYRYIYGKTYLEVKQKRKAAMSEAERFSQKLANTKKISFYHVTEEWMALKKGQVKQSTYANYINLLENHLFPELGEIYISALSTQYLEDFLQKKLICGRLDGKGGLSNKTVADIRSLLKLILEYAKKRGYFCPSNLKISIPSGHTPKIQILNKREQEQLEQILFSDSSPLCFGILIALYGGLRIGEVCALQWKDFCFEEGTVNINKTLLRIRNTDQNSERKTKLIIERPKTECSNRVIPLPDFLLSYLKNGECEKEAYFLTGTTQFMEPRVCLNKYKKILEKAGIQNYSFHALRHTFATRCVENNFDIKSLSEIMGHSNISITMQRYVHPSMEQKKTYMNTLCSSAYCGQNCGQ